MYAQPAASVDPGLAEISATIWIQQASVSPDGARLAYVQSVGPGKSAIYFEGTPQPVSTGAQPCDEHSVAWSPDSRQIAGQPIGQPAPFVSSRLHQTGISQAGVQAAIRPLRKNPKVKLLRL